MRNFPAEARRQVAFELDAVQRGLKPFDWKPMTGIGMGVREICVHVLGEWRQDRGRDLCPACFSKFQKKTHRTRREDIKLARRRFRQIGE